jgi:hypothetical protein
MEKNQSIAVPEPEIQNILKEQVAVNVVLNNGAYELDDATVPFQIGFNEEIANKKPTHVLVIDITQHVFNPDGTRQEGDRASVRTLLKLEPINYLPLNKSGEHHLIFILFRDFPKWFNELLFKKSICYEKKIEFAEIEINNLCYQVGYCEKVISIPKEAFSHKPTTGFKKAIWYWVNSWHDFEAFDPCEYKKRMRFAFTIKPIIWFLGFMARFLIAILVTAAQFIIRIWSLLFGYQPARFFPHFKELWWHFLFRYTQSPLKMDEVFDFTDYWTGNTVQEKYFDGADEEDFHEYKFHSILGTKFRSPLTILGAGLYAVGVFMYIDFIKSMFSFQIVNFPESIRALSLAFIISLLASLMLAYKTLPTLSGSDKWKQKWDFLDRNYKNRRNLSFLKSLGAFSGLAFLAFVISALGRFMISHPASNSNFIPPSTREILATIIHGVGIGLLFLAAYFLLKWLFKSARVLIIKVAAKSQASTKEAKKTKAEKRLEWLKSSFKLENLPAKVDVDKAPAPSSSIHRFVIKRWQFKAKVCRPYAKD